MELLVQLLAIQDHLVQGKPNWDELLFMKIKSRLVDQAKAPSYPASFLQ